MSRSLRAVAVGAVLAAVCAFYFWTTISNYHPYQFGAPGYHNLLADAFLAGQLPLLVQPRPELLALEDRYDPRQNRRYRHHDLSLYRDKYYLYWGPVPALVLFAPYKAALGRYLDQNLAVPLFCFGGLLWSGALLLLLTRTYVPETPWWMRLIAICALALSNVAPFLIRRPEVYEVAIAS